MFHLLLKCLNERLAPVMPYLAQELHNELSVLDHKEKKINDVFENQFTSLERAFTDISPELASTMAIVFHLRDTFHKMLQNRRAILCDIVLYLSDKAKDQVRIRLEFNSNSFQSICLVKTSDGRSRKTSIRKFDENRILFSIVCISDG